jgi:hypothetical protein
MRTVETILIREGIKEKDGGGKSKIYCKHFCECQCTTKYTDNNSKVASLLQYHVTAYLPCAEHLRVAEEQDKQFKRQC